MPTAVPDPERTPVVIASGQAIERVALVNPVDLMARASESALADAPALRDHIDRLSVVDVMTKVGPAPATELADRLDLGPDVVREVTTVGGNTPQWLVNRAASEIAAGSLSVTLIAGAEAIRSSRARRAEGLARDEGRADLAPDPVVGDDLPGFGPAELAISLLAPIHVYPLFENVLAARAGRDADAQRRAIGELMAPFTRVAAAHPYAWFREERTAVDIATESCSLVAARLCPTILSDFEVREFPVPNSGSRPVVAPVAPTSTVPQPVVPTTAPVTTPTTTPAAPTTTPAPPPSTATTSTPTPTP